MILERMFEKRASFSETNPRDPVLAEWFGGASNTAAGISVNPDRAMQLSAVFACVRVLSSSVASLPLSVFRTTADGKESLPNNPYYLLLHNAPNRWQTSFEFIEQMQGHLLLRGNAYAQIVYRGNGTVSELIPLNPDRMTVARMPSGDITYSYSADNNKIIALLKSEVLHVRGYSSDGIKGLSPIEYMRETVGLTMAAEEFGARYFGNGTVIGGVLEHPGKLGDQAFTRLKSSWSDRHQGPANSHKPAILEEGMKWHALGVPPEQAQFLETRKFQISEIARIFGVPPHMIGDVEKSTSWGSGIEQQGIGFVVYSLRPWLVRWEQCIKRDLLNTSMTKDVHAEFVVEGLLRGDSSARKEFYKDMFAIGVMSQNDIRRKESMNPIDGGDKYYVPLNMVSTDKVDDDATEEFTRDAVERVISCETRAIERMLKDYDSFAENVVRFYQAHDKFIERALGPVLNGDGFAKHHIDESLRQLAGCRDADDINTIIERWRKSRAKEMMEAIHEQR